MNMNFSYSDQSASLSLSPPSLLSFITHLPFWFVPPVSLSVFSFSISSVSLFSPFSFSPFSTYYDFPLFISLFLSPTHVPLFVCLQSSPCPFSFLFIFPFFFFTINYSPSHSYYHLFLSFPSLLYT